MAIIGQAITPIMAKMVITGVMARPIMAIIMTKAKVKIRDYSIPASNPVNISTPQNPKTGFEFDLVKIDIV